FSFSLLVSHRHPHSFPTRRSSDLDRIASVIVEPVAGNMGCVPPAPGFLQALREITSAHGALLIFDEVMTGFRLARGGAQELYGIDRKSTRLNSSHGSISYAVFCLK